MNTDTRLAAPAAQLDIIPFHGIELYAVQSDGVPQVVLKPIFESIGMDADQQIRKIQRQPWATTGVSTVVAADGKVRKMITADLRTLLMALATIPVSRVSEEARPFLMTLQCEVADVVEAFYLKGAAINPRVTPEQLPAVLDRATADYRTEREKRIAEDEAERRASARISAEQVALLNLAKSTGILDDAWIATKMQVVLARGFGETPQIESAELPLYVEEFMKSKGVAKAKISRFSSAFGRKIVAHAVLDGVPVPGKRTQEMPDGTIREITAWTKKDLPLFERAWNASYAQDERLFG